MYTRKRVEEDHLEKLLEIVGCRLRKKICFKKVLCMFIIRVRFKGNNICFIVYSMDFAINRKYGNKELVGVQTRKTTLTVVAIRKKRQNTIVVG